MDFQQFQNLVEQMRHEQKEYFRTRSAQSLEESKRLEKEVDKALRELADKQERMF